jgi:hypothetical protein
VCSLLDEQANSLCRERGEKQFAHAGAHDRNTFRGVDAGPEDRGISDAARHLPEHPAGGRGRRERAGIVEGERADRVDVLRRPEASRIETTLGRRLLPPLVLLGGG